MNDIKSINKELLHEVSDANKEINALYELYNGGQEEVIDRIREINGKKNKMMDELISKGYGWNWLMDNFYDYELPFSHNS